MEVPRSGDAMAAMTAAVDDAVGLRYVPCCEAPSRATDSAAVLWSGGLGPANVRLAGWGLTPLLLQLTGWLSFRRHLRAVLICSNCNVVS